MKDDFQIVPGVRFKTKNTAELVDGYKRPGMYRSNPDVVEELKSLALKDDGLLKPQSVVEAARSEDSPLHHLFEWDDTEAAERYRMVQARAVISVSVEYLPVGNKVRPQKVFVSLSSDRRNREGEGGGGYRTLISVISDKDKRQELVQDALKDMRHFEERYKNLKEVQSVIDAIQKTKSAIA